LVCFKNRTSQHIINACNDLAYDVDSIADTINSNTECYKLKGLKITLLRNTKVVREVIKKL
ncbi:hypothetical protein, partial [Kocuria sabuli]|uniref:hypothetical protein n=1 Tax=Kocuria sabuli TaxID=3071448 RepID=UPI0034D72463